MENTNTMKIVDILDENELIDILIGSFNRNGTSDVIVVDGETVSYLLSELIKSDEFSLGFVELETGIYDDYNLGLYHILIDEDANVIVEKAYNDWFDSKSYGKPLFFDANIVWCDQEVVSQEYIDFLEDQNMNIALFGYFDESNELSEIFEYEKCIDCDSFDECWGSESGSDEKSEEHNDNNKDSKTNISITINGKTFDINGLKESDIFKKIDKLTNNFFELYKL